MVTILPRFRFPHKAEYLLILVMESRNAWIFWEQDNTLCMISRSISVEHTSLRKPLLFLLKNFKKVNKEYSAELIFYKSGVSSLVFSLLWRHDTDRIAKIIAFFDKKMDYNMAIGKTVYLIDDNYYYSNIYVSTQRNAGIRKKIKVQLIPDRWTRFYEIISINIPDPALQLTGSHEYYMISDIRNTKDISYMLQQIREYWGDPTSKATSLFILAKNILSYFSTKNNE